MTRFMLPTVLLALLSLLLATPVVAQQPHRAPPSKQGKGHKKHKKHKKHHEKPHKHRAPPAEPSMPVRQPQEVKHFNPMSGPPGTLVKIHGKHFDDTTRVRFNGRWITVTKQERNLLEVRIPPTAVTDSFVIHKAGFPDLTTDQQFGVVRPAQIIGFRPRDGGYGTTVKIKGQHFLPTDSFVIGSMEMSTIKIKPNRARAQIPNGARTDRIGVKRDGRVIAWSRMPFNVFGPPPVISSFSPTQGERGTVVRINGRNFEPPDQVLLAGRPLRIQGRSPGHFEVVIGPQRSGPFVVRGHRGRQTRSAGVFTVLRPPVIRRFSPSYGPPGTRITFHGAGFAPGDQVFVGSGMLTIRTLQDQQIVAELPAGVSGGAVYVQRGGRKFQARGRFEVVYPPAITNLQPRSAPPGARIVIQGRHFMPGISVTLAGRPLRIVRKRLPSELEVQIPGNGRTGQIVAVTRGGSARSPFPFQVTHYAQIASFFPLHGLPGTMVTLRGQNFHRGMRVYLENMEQPIRQLAPHEIKVQILQGARSGRLRLDSYGQTIYSRLPFTVDKPRPELTFSFAPTTARRGSEVTLTLSPARQGVMVFFDGRPLPKKTLGGGNRIIVTVPGDARSGYFELEYRGKRYRASQMLRVR